MYGIHDYMYRQKSIFKKTAAALLFDVLHYILH